LHSLKLILPPKLNQEVTKMRRIGFIGHFVLTSFIGIAYALGALVSRVFDLALPTLRWDPPAITHLHADHLERELRASTIVLSATGERFKAFIRRRLQHAENVGDGYLPEAIIIGTA
jgi:hypothetical protein